MADFEQSRLSIALRRRGMTKKDLAEKCGVSPQYISNIENGKTNSPPSATLIGDIAAALRFPTEFFYGEPIEFVSIDEISFRSRRGTPARVRDIGLATSTLASSVIGPDLEARFHLPALDVPDLSRCAKPQIAAEVLRDHWGLGNGPVQNMVHLLESRGILVFWLYHENPALDAASFWREDRPYVFLNTLKAAGDRARYDAAHELGHLVLHRNAASIKGTNKKQDTEREANLFASAFLLPSPTFREACPSTINFSTLYHMKQEWKVSVAAMIMRGADLGIFSESETRVAFQKLNARGELRNERVKFPRETSKLHDMAFAAFGKKGISPDDYAAMLKLDAMDLYELMPSAKKFVPELPMKSSHSRGHMRVI